MLLAVAALVGDTSARTPDTPPAPATQPSRTTPTPTPTTTTTPTEPVEWSEVVPRLAGALVDPQIREREVPLFLASATVRALGSQSADGPAVLRGRFDGQIVLSARAYIVPEMSPATQLGEDVAEVARRLANTAGALPESLVRALTPPADATLSAEMAASLWLLSSLNAGNDSRVGLVVLWLPEATRDADAFATGDTDVYSRLSFVLLRGALDPLGRWRIADARYATAEQVLAK